MAKAEFVKCYKCGKERRLLWDIFKYDDGNYYCIECKKKVSIGVLPKKDNAAPARMGCYMVILAIAIFFFFIFSLAGVGGIIAVVVESNALNQGQLINIAIGIIIACMVIMPWYLLISVTTHKLYMAGYFKKQSKFFSMFGAYLEKKKIIEETEMQRPEAKEEITAEKKVKVKKTDIEEVVISKWFTVLGVIITVLGLSSLLVYSLKYFGAIGKICTGFCFGALGLILGSYLELKKKYFNLGKALIGGSWALVYFTAYAMHSIANVRVIQSPFIGLLILLGVGGLCILHTYKYRSEMITGLNYLLIFTSLCLNARQMGMSLFPLGAILIVAISMAFFEIKMRWVYLMALGQAATYLTFIIWFSSQFRLYAENFDFVIQVIGILFLYWLIYSIANYLTRPRTIEEFGGKHIGYATNLIAYWSINNVLFYKITFLSPLYFNFCLLLASLTALFGRLAYRQKERLYFITNSIYTAILLGLGLSFKIEGFLLTCVLLFLAESLFILGLYTKEKSICKAAIIGFAGMIYKMFLCDINFAPPSIVPHLNQRILLWAAAFFIFAFNYLISKRKKDFVKGSNLIMVGFLYAALFILGSIARLELPSALVGVAWGLISLILFQKGVDKDDVYFRIGSYIFIIGAVWRLFLSNLTLMSGMCGVSYRLLTSMPVFAILVYFYAVTRNYAKLLNKEKFIIPILSYTAFILLLFILRYELVSSYVCLGWELVSIMCLGGFILLKDINILRQACIAAISATVRGIFFNLSYGARIIDGQTAALLAFITMGFIVIENLFCNIYKQKIGDIIKSGKGKFAKLDRRAKDIFAICAALLLSWIIGTKSKLVLLTIFFCIEGLALYILGLIFLDRIWRLLGVGLLLFSIFKIFIIDASRLGTLLHILSMIVLGFFLIFVSFLYAKYRHRIPKII